MRIQAPVFFPAAAIILLAVGVTIAFQAEVRSFFTELPFGIATTAGWFLTLVMNVALLFAVQHERRRLQWSL